MLTSSLVEPAEGSLQHLARSARGAETEGDIEGGALERAHQQTTTEHPRSERLHDARLVGSCIENIAPAAFGQLDEMRTSKVPAHESMIDPLGSSEVSKPARFTRSQDARSMELRGQAAHLDWMTDPAAQLLRAAQALR